MSRRSLYPILHFAIVVLSLGSCAQADPLVYLYMVGREAGSDRPFSTQLTAQPGESIEYAVMGQMAPVGTSNTQRYDGKPLTRTIRSLHLDTTPALGDGIQSLMLDLYQDPHDAFQVDITSSRLNPNPTNQPHDDWAGEGNFHYGDEGTPTLRPGTSQGYHDLLRIWAIHGAGIFTAATAPEIILSGTITIPQCQEDLDPNHEPAWGAKTLIRLRWAEELGNGAIKFNASSNKDGGDIVFLGRSPDTGDDPLLAFRRPPPTFRSRARTTSSDNGGFTEGLSIQVVPEAGTATMLLAFGALSFTRRRTTEKASEKTGTQ